nr:integrase core domain-containing protein [Desulfocurvibacter africanus]
MWRASEPGGAVEDAIVERLWHSLKYECVYLHAFERGSQARLEIGKGLVCYNFNHPNSRLHGGTPDEVHAEASFHRLGNAPGMSPSHLAA